MMLETTSRTNENSSNKATKCERSEFIGNYPLFQKYCLSGLCRLGLEPLKETDIHGIWKQVESFAVRYFMPFIQNRTDTFALLKKEKMLYFMLEAHVLANNGQLFIQSIDVICLYIHIPKYCLLHRIFESPFSGTFLVDESYMYAFYLYLVRKSYLYFVVYDRILLYI